MNYVFLDDDSNLLDRPAELVEVDLSLVVDVEELEGFCEEGVLLLVGRALLHELLSELSLEAGNKRDAYSLRMRCIV